MSSFFKCFIFFCWCIGFICYGNHESYDSSKKSASHSLSRNPFDNEQRKNPHYSILKELFDIELEKMMLTNEGYCVPYSWESSLHAFFPLNRTAVPNDPVLIHQCFDHSRSIGVYLTDYLRQFTCAKLTGAHFLSPPLVDVDPDSEEDFDLDLHHHHGASQPHRPYHPSEPSRPQELEHNPYTKHIHQLRMLLLEYLPKMHLHPKPQSIETQKQLQQLHCQCQTLYDCLQDPQSAFRLEKSLILEVLQYLNASFAPYLAKYSETMINFDYDEIDLPVQQIHLLPSSPLPSSLSSSIPNKKNSETAPKKRHSIVIGDDKASSSSETSSTTSTTTTAAAASSSTAKGPDWLQNYHERITLPLIPDIAIYYHCNDDYDPHVSSAGILSFASIANQLEAVILQQITEATQKPKRSQRRRSLRVEGIHYHNNNTTTTASKEEEDREREREGSSSSSSGTAHPPHSPSSSSSSHPHHHHHNNNNHTLLPPTRLIPAPSPSASASYSLRYIYLLCETGQHVSIPHNYQRYPSLRHTYMKCSLMVQWLYQYLQERLAKLLVLKQSSLRYLLVVKRNSHFMVDFYRLSQTPVVISSFASFSFYPLLLHPPHPESHLYLPAILPLYASSERSTIFAQFHPSFESLSQSKAFSVSEILQQPFPWRLAYFSLVEQARSLSSLDAFVVQGKGRSVYLLKGGAKHEFLSGSDFESLGYEWGEVMRVDQRELDAVPAGPPVSL